ncbi:MAG: hypothetical protein RBS73_13240 [Prolixibacteraceae bacterium]|jgi:hypothetical protein|nr:hypothetical protein [Prolixibacteraceae bacterium]
MEPGEVKILLQKFFDGQTTVEEEMILSDFFSNQEVPAGLEIYRNFFVAAGELSSVRFEGFEEEVMDHILESENRERKKYRWLWQTVTSAAAVLLLAVLLVNYNQDETQIKDTYSDPEIAYAEATKTLRYMAGKYQKGMVQLQPVAIIDKASAPLKNSFKLVNKGFEEVDELVKMNEKLKK